MSDVKNLMVWVLGFSVKALGVKGLGSQGIGFRLWFRDSGFRFCAQGNGFRVKGRGL